MSDLSRLAAVGRTASVLLIAALALPACEQPQPDSPPRQIHPPSAADPAPEPHLQVSAGLPGSISDYHLRRFRERGLQDPRREIPADLAGRPELIPEEGVLGGTMRFTEVTLLTERWVLATFEDGHIQGRAIFEYSVEEGGSIQWSVVDHYVD